MKYKTNTKKYLDVVFGASKPNLLFDLKDIKIKKELGEALVNRILDKDSPKTVSQKPKRDQVFLANKIFMPLSEILSSLEVMENITIYIRSCPYKRQGISKVAYLKYHIENYLNELYILELRLKNYLRLISRSYTKTERKDKIDKITKQLEDFIMKAFESYRITRGHHVHKYRYTDNDLDHLSTLNLFINSKGKLGNIVNLIFKRKYSDIRKKWCKKMELDIKNIHELLEIYFKHMLSIISIKGKIIYPFN